MKSQQKRTRILMLSFLFLAVVFSTFEVQAQNFCVDFDGKSGSSVEAEHNASYDKIERELTMEAWVFPQRTLDEIIVNKEDCWEIGLKNGLLVCAVAPDGGVAWDWSGTAKIAENQWSHVAVVHDGTNLLTFLNGKLESSEDKWKMAKGQTLKKSAHPFLVGMRVLGGPLLNDPILGLIDEVRISSVARYTKDFPVPKQEFEPDDHTIVLYHFNERPGSKVAKDESEHGNDGELMKGTKFVASDAPIAPAAVEPANKLSTTWGKLKSIHTKK
jgi:hypothetical protein